MLGRPTEEEAVMHRTGRPIGRGYVFAVAALVLSACGSSGTNSPANAPSSGSPTTSAAGTTTPTASASAAAASFPIPNGTFDATASREEALAEGFSNKEIDAQYGPDGKLPVTLVLDDGTYQAFVVGDDGVKELGDKGTYTATQTRWILTDEVEAVAGYVYTYRWSFDGKVLSLELLSDSGGPADFRIVRLVTEHDYVKAG
jgi:hypothetical protein